MIENLSGLALPVIIARPKIAISLYRENPVTFADILFEDFPRINSKVLRVLLYQLHQEGSNLAKLWKCRSHYDLPEWYYQVDTIPLENLLVGIKYELPLAPDGNLILWWQIGRPLNKDLLNVLLFRGIDLNQINRSEGLTLLQKAVQIGSEQNVQLLLSHRANPETPSLDGKTAMDIALDPQVAFLNDTVLTPDRSVQGSIALTQSVSGPIVGISLRIIRTLKVYGAHVKPDITISEPDVRRYLKAASLIEPVYAIQTPEQSILDQDEDLVLQAIINPEVIENSDFQTVTGLGPSNIEAFKEGIKLKNKEVIVTQNGDIMSWPFYFPPGKKSSHCPLPPSGSRLTVALPPKADRVYQLALSGLSDIPDQDRVISPGMNVYGTYDQYSSIPIVRPRAPNIVPTDLYPYQSDVIPLPVSV